MPQPFDVRDEAFNEIKDLTCGGYTQFIFDNNLAWCFFGIFVGTVCLYTVT